MWYPGGDTCGKRHRDGVHEAGGLNEDGSSAYSGGGIGEVAGEDCDDLIPPPFETDAETGRDSEAEERGELLEGSEGPATPGELTSAGEVEVGEEEKCHVEIGEDGGECDAWYAEMEHKGE